MKIFILFACLFTLSSLPLVTPSFAAVLLIDDFNYPDGGLAGNPTGSPAPDQWTNFNTGTAIQVTGNKVALANTGAEAYRLFSASGINSGSLYCGMTINVSTARTGDLITCFAPTGGGTSNLRSFIQTSGAGFVIGASKVTTPTYGSTVLTLNTDYRMVFRYDYVAGTSNDVLKLYVNPADPNIEANNTPYLTISSGSDSAITASYFELFQNVGTQAPTMTLDTLRLATDFNSAAVPEPSALCLLSFAMLGLVVIRRR